MNGYVIKLIGITDVGILVMDTSKTDFSEIYQLIQTEPLTSTINRLLMIDGWSPKHIPEAIKQYRNYIFLIRKWGHQYKLPPSVDIDDVWHAHILHTREYTEFCNTIFGHYLHHDPHTEGDFKTAKIKLQTVFEEETQMLYYQEFGDYIYTVRNPSLFKMISKGIKKIAEIFTHSQKTKEEFLYHYKQESTVAP